MREHAVGPRDQARRHREEHVGTDGRGAQHRRRRPADPRRCAHVRRALRARGRGRHRHADRRDGDRARPRRRAASSATTTRWRARCSARATTRTTARGSCRCGTTTRKAWPATSPTSPTSPAAPAAASPPRASCRASPRSTTGRISTSPASRGTKARTRAPPAVRCRCSRPGCSRRRTPAPRRRPSAERRMTSIDFYTHVDDRLAVAARLVAKAYAAHGSVRVLTPDAADHRRARPPAVDASAAGVPAALPMDSPLAAETPIWIDERARARRPRGGAGQPARATRRRSSAASSAWPRSSGATKTMRRPAARAASSIASAATSCARTTWPSARKLTCPLRASCSSRPTR